MIDPIEFGVYKERVDELRNDVGELKASPVLTPEAASWCIAESAKAAKDAAEAQAHRQFVDAEKNRLLDIAIIAPLGGIAAGGVGFALGQILPHIHLPFL